MMKNIPIKPPSQYVRILLLGLFIVTWLSIIIFVGWKNADEGKKRINKMATAGMKTDRPFNGLILSANYTSIDINKFSYMIHVEFKPIGGYVRTDDTSFETLSQNISLTIGGQTHIFPAGQEMYAVDAPMMIKEGDINAYPFDIYNHIFDISSSLYNSNNSDRINRIPIAFSIVGALQTFSIETSSTDILKQQPGIHIRVQTTIRRSFTTVFFSMFIIILMWIISVSTLILATTIWTRGRKVEPPTIAFVSSMLFALPAVRNVQPGVPSLGCTADVVGFFWNMFMISVSAILLIINYIVRYQSEYLEMFPQHKEEGILRKITKKFTSRQNTSTNNNNNNHKNNDLTANNNSMDDNRLTVSNMSYYENAFNSNNTKSHGIKYVV